MRGGDRPSDYTHRYGFQATIIHCALTQLSMKGGLKKSKQKDEKAATAELEQLHKRDVFWTASTYDLSEKHNHDFLALLIFLK